MRPSRLQREFCSLDTEPPGASGLVVIHCNRKNRIASLKMEVWYGVLCYVMPCDVMLCVDMWRLCCDSLWSGMICNVML